MNLTEFIKQVLVSFEQSRSTIQYDKIYIYRDGPDRCRQITVSFGITEYGNLKTLVEDYCEGGGKYAEQLKEYIPKIGKTPLVNDEDFIQLLKDAGEDPKMQNLQEHEFDKLYINPALTWCDNKHIVLPLSKLVVADSYLHSGSMLKTIRNQFSEVTPVDGGDERAWITAYCKARKQWLANNINSDLHNTVYRMNFMLDLINKGDWNLTQSKYVANDVVITT